MKRSVWLIVGLALIGGLVVGVYLATPRPTHLSGDAWDYTILSDEVPEGWKLDTHGVVTAHDVAQENLETALPITDSVSLSNLRELYYVRYRPPTLSDYVDFTVQTLLYASDAAAMAAMAQESPGPEWESVSTPQIGDESQVWHFLNPDPTLDQNIFRVDFRYLNGIGSVTMMGTRGALPDVDEPVSYARAILTKMRSAATPADLRRLQRARLPDLRTLLLSQDQITQRDGTLGGRWQLDSRSIPGWTPNASFGSREARGVLEQLGRITGYQMYLVKPLSAAERRNSFPEGMFQQVSAYPDADAAHLGLSSMVGVEQLSETKPSPVLVGDETRIWSGLLPTTTADGSSVVVAVHEVNLRVGQYVASIRLQSRALAPDERTSGRLRTLDLTLVLAEALAANLRGAGNP